MEDEEQPETMSSHVKVRPPVAPKTYLRKSETCQLEKSQREISFDVQEDIGMASERVTDGFNKKFINKPMIQSTLEPYTNVTFTENKLRQQDTTLTIEKNLDVKENVHETEVCLRPKSETRLAGKQSPVPTPRGSLPEKNLMTVDGNNSLRKNISDECASKTELRFKDEKQNVKRLTQLFESKLTTAGYRTHEEHNEAFSNVQTEIDTHGAVYRTHEEHNEEFSNVQTEIDTHGAVYRTHEEHNEESSNVQTEIDTHGAVYHTEEQQNEKLLDEQTKITTHGAVYRTQEVQNEEFLNVQAEINSHGAVYRTVEQQNEKFFDEQTEITTHEVIYRREEQQNDFLDEQTGINTHGDTGLKRHVEGECNIGSDEGLESSSSYEQTQSISCQHIEERFRALPIFQKPEQLIYTDERNILVINDIAMNQIGSIDLPLNIVAICGHFRTGKSYLLNKLANENTGFRLGSTVSSETKGIWAWCKPHPTHKHEVLLLLDTEGMSDIKKGDSDHDSKLFCLATLLSSTLIYNQKDVFDQDSLVKLSFITEMSENIRTAGEEDLTFEENDETIRLLTPTFILCLRDFYLELIEYNNDADAYFEEALKLSSEPGKEANNHIKKCLRKYFPKRKCITISQPGIGKKLLCLESLDETELAEEFLSDMKRLKDFVYSCKPKELDATKKHLVDGLAFQAFARTYVKALEHGNTTSFINAYAEASQSYNRKLVTVIVQQYKEEIDAIPLPVPKKQVLQEKCLELRKEKMHVLTKKLYPYHKKNSREEALKRMKVFRDEKLKENSYMVQATLAKIITEIHDANIRECMEKYENEHGLFMYKQDVENIGLTFLEVTKDFDPVEQSTAILTYKKNTKGEKRKLKLREEEERIAECVRRQMDALKKQENEETEAMERENEEIMDNELKDMEKKFHKLMGKHKKSIWEKFKLLFYK